MQAILRFGALTTFAVVGGMSCDAILGLKRATLIQAVDGGGTTGTGSTGGGGAASSTSTTSSSTTTTTAGTGGAGGAVAQPTLLAHFANVRAQGVVADAATGAIYLAGKFPGTATFGATVFPTAGGNDMFLVKLSSSGEVAWAKHVGGGKEDEGQNVAFANHSVTVTGQAPAGVMVEGQPIPPVAAGSVPAYFVARYDESGTFQWLGSCAGQGFSDLAVDPTNGDTILAGSFFGYQCGAQSYYPKQDRDIFVTRLDSTAGTELKTTTFHGGQFNYARTVAIDNFKNVFLGGWVDTSVLIGPYVLPDGAMYAAKIDKAGGVPWAIQVGTGIFDAVVSDADGNLIAYGRCGDPLKPFGDPAMPAPGNGPICIAKLSGATGSVLWARRFGTAGVEAGPSKVGVWDYPTRTLVVDAAGDVAIVGYTGGPLSLDGFPITHPGYIARLDGKTGSVHSAASLDFVTAGLAVTSQDALVLVGTFGPGTINIGATPLTTAAGEVDTFVALLPP